MGDKVNSKLRQQYTTEFLNRVESVLNKKGNDYASNDDAFSNFTNTSTINKIPVEKVFTGEITKKISRIVELIGKPAACESIMDSILDIAGYACLMENYLRGVAEARGVADEDSGNKEVRSYVGPMGEGTIWGEM
jgi:hypothetical protein